MSELTWSTACPNWEQLIVNGDSLVPCKPLFRDEADAAMRIFRDLRLVDVANSPTIGEAARPWFLDFAEAVFGAYDAKTGRRLIRYFFLLISKKNAKSTLAAAIMLTALLRNWRLSGEYYILAPTKEVADNSYAPARDMVRADEELSTLLHCQDNYRTITHRNTGAFLRVVAADNEVVAGKKTIGLFIDELWLFGKRATAHNIISEAMGGLASRPEGFVIYASTQSDSQPAGVFEKELKRFRGIRDGSIIDPRSMGVLYEFPKRFLESGEFKDRANWYITNPNMHASVDEEYIADKLGKAETDGPSELVSFYSKHLNVEITQGLRADGWIGAKFWPDAADNDLKSLARLIERSEVLCVGIDGGSLDDLLGVSVVGREKTTKNWLCWAHAFISPIGWDRRQANQTVYQTFIDDKDLTKVDKLPDDVSAVVDIVRQCRDSKKLAKVGCDPAGLATIVDALASIKVTVDNDTLGGVRQGVGLMGSINGVARKLVDGSFKHSGSRLMAWCAGNAIIQPTGTGIRVARDASGYGKIDPLVAMFDAAELMSTNPGVAREPEYQVLFA